MNTLPAAKTDSAATGKVTKGSFWSKFMGANNASKQQDSGGQEEPVLS
jgi:hypothetical protein